MSHSLDDEKKQAEIDKLRAETEKARQETLKIQTQPLDISRNGKIALAVISALGPIFITILTGVGALYFAYKSNLFDSQTKYAESEQKLAEAKQLTAEYETRIISDRKDSLTKRYDSIAKKNDSITNANHLLIINTNGLRRKDSTLSATVNRNKATISGFEAERAEVGAEVKHYRQEKETLVHMIDSIQKAHNNEYLRFHYKHMEDSLQLLRRHQ